MGLLDWFRPQTPITAAVVNGARSSNNTTPSVRTESQQVTEAWKVWRQVGEIHYATSQQSRLISRVKWHLIVNDVPVDDTDEVLTAVFGKNLRDLQDSAATHLQVAGAYYLARVAPGDNSSWKVLPNPPDYKSKKDLDKADVFVSVRNPDPRDEQRNDSPVIASLDIARELLLARSQSRAASRNRTAQLNTVLYPLEGAGKDTDQFEQDLTDVITAPLEDEYSSSAVVPNLIGFQAEYIDKWRTLDLTGPIDEKLSERITTLVKQLALTLDITPELLLGLSDSNHWCRPTRTLAYTRDGWAAPVIGDEVLTASGWSPVKDLYRADATGDIGVRLTLRAEASKPYTQEATVGHRFYICRNGQDIVTKFPQIGDKIYRGRKHFDDRNSVLPNALVELLAWYSSDGTCTWDNGAPRQMRIAKRANWPELERVLKDNFGSPVDSFDARDTKPAWRVAEHRENGLRVASLNAVARDTVLEYVPAKNKAIPMELINQFSLGQLELFMTAWSMADGIRRGHQIEILQRDPERLVSAEYAAIRLGYAVTRFTKRSAGYKDGLMHGIKVTDKATATVVSMELFEINGEVWCPVTEDGTWLAFDPESGWADYTGNSSWASQEDNWLGHVEPLAAPIGRGFAEAITLAADSTDVIELEPDPSPLLQRRPTIADALQAYQLGLVSDEWTRTQLGAGEEDAGPGQPLDQQVPAEDTPAVAEPVQPAELAPVAAAVEPPFNTQRLADIDTDTYDDVDELIKKTTLRALSRLGAKIRAAAQGRDIELPSEVSNADIAVKFDGEVPNAQAAIDDTVEKSVGDFDRLVNRAERRTKLAGVPLELDPQDKVWAANLYTQLTRAHIALALDGKATDADRWEETRRVVAVAGGNGDTGPANPTAAAIKTTGNGIALGKISLDVIRDVFELVSDEWTWIHLYTGDNPHPEHEELDGVTFNGDWVLKDGINWSPGDHDGCRCQAMPVWRYTT